MFSQLKSSVVNLFHHFRHSDDMAQRPVIPSVSEHITAYCQKLEAINDSIGTERLQGYRVVELAGFKTNALSRHEYARANVEVPNVKKITPLAFERLRGETFEIDTTSQNSEASTPNPITHSSSDSGQLTARLASSSRSSLTSVSASLSPQHFADDRVTPLPPSGKWSSDDKPLFILTFNSKPLYLHELALLVELIHNENKSYKLLSNNCYHFVGTLVSTLERTHSAKVKLDTSEDDAGKCCCGLNILPFGRGDVSSICKKFTKCCQDFWKEGDEQKIARLERDNARLRDVAAKG